MRRYFISFPPQKKKIGKLSKIFLPFSCFGTSQLLKPLAVCESPWGSKAWSLSFTNLYDAVYILGSRFWQVSYLSDIQDIFSRFF